MKSSDNVRCLVSLLVIQCPQKIAAADVTICHWIYHQEEPESFGRISLEGHRQSGHLAKHKTPVNCTNMMCLCDLYFTRHGSIESDWSEGVYWCCLFCIHSSSGRSGSYCTRKLNVLVVMHYGSCGYKSFPGTYMAGVLNCMRLIIN